MGEDGLKRSDLTAMLEACRTFTDTGDWPGLFTYPGCGWDLVQMGLATQDKRITTAGRAALYLMQKGDDPLPESKSFVSISFPLNEPATP